MKNENKEIEKIVEDFSQFVDKLFSRAHIPDYANDTKFSLKREFSQYLFSYRNAILEEERKRIKLEIEEITKRYKCAACAGANCEHTLGCQSLTELKEKLGL